MQNFSFRVIEAVGLYPLLMGLSIGNLIVRRDAMRVVSWKGNKESGLGRSKVMLPGEMLMEVETLLTTQGRIFRFRIRSYDSRFHHHSTILRQYSNI
ncbi:hypothetical protein CMV_000649 [Castanea mollissima]|uniref:Uncharacterized protein n=1 Tax=Castanea mollissima TaxID=60419 RepID=A0A8J4VXI9_9ROSI|nr:hypothetical protein CMV_000649 [Castanea mollissima]